MFYGKKDDFQYSIIATMANLKLPREIFIEETLTFYGYIGVPKS